MLETFIKQKLMLRQMENVSTVWMENNLYRKKKETESL